MTEQTTKHEQNQLESERQAQQIAGQLRRPSGPQAREIGLAMNQANEPLYELILRTMQLADHQTILEIGCGNGKFFEKLFSQASHLHITGIDHSPEMVSEAIANNPTRMSTGQLSVVLASSESLPFPSSFFDKVFCSMVIYFWEHASLHLQEIHRVLQPGGRFYTGFRSKQSMSLFPFTKHGFILYTEEEWKQLLQENGFTFVGTRESSGQVQIDHETFGLSSLCIEAVKEPA